MNRNIDNSQDILNGYDINARIDELQDCFESEHGAALESYNEEKAAAEEEKREVELDEIPEDFEIWLASSTDPEAEELKMLKDLAEEVDQYAGDGLKNAVLVRESYFEEYCQDLCEEIGDLPKDLPSYLVIDWEATASNLKSDYTEVDYDGVAYLVRS